MKKVWDSSCLAALHLDFSPPGFSVVCYCPLSLTLCPREDFESVMDVDLINDSNVKLTYDALTSQMVNCAPNTTQKNNFDIWEM